MNRTEKLLMFRWGVFATVLGICMMMIWIGTGRVKADPDPELQATNTPDPNDVDYVNKEEYINGYFDGVVTVNTVNVRSGPGTTYELVRTSGGKSVKITNGNGKKVTIIGESKDKELEAWYHVRFEYQDDSMEAPEIVEGYCFAQFIRKEAKVTFTPTPTPAEEEKGTPTPTIAGADEVMRPNDTPSEGNEKQLEESKGFEPWKYVLILAIVLVVLSIVYTVYNRMQESRVEAEMERYSNRPTFEQLEGEREEDFLEAKQNYYNYLKLGDQSNRDLGEELGNPDDIQLDLNGLFETEDVEEIARTVQTEQDDIASNYQVETDEFFDEASGEEFAEEFTCEDITEPSKEEWTPEEASVLTEETHASADTTPKEDIRIYQKPVSEEKTEQTVVTEPMPAPVSSPEVEMISPEEAMRRKKLEQLKEQEWIWHKLYGEGEVIDNSDSEIIQVRFGRDLRFLKKEKLARKDLVVFK